MSEKYVKEILEKLEEIEKLHATLRSLVPRVKNNETENKLNGNPNCTTKDNHPVANETNESDTGSTEQKPINFARRSINKGKEILDTNGATMKYLRKIRRNSRDRMKRFGTNSMDYITKQWQDKNERIKNFLSSLNEPDIILVSRASQTTDDQVNVISETSHRRSTLEDVSKWLSEHFDNNRDSNYTKDHKVSIQGHGLSSNKPRRVQKTLLIPDQETETLKIISSARGVSVSENGKPSVSNNEKRKLSGKFFS